jgi:hypothetical protein
VALGPGVAVGVLRFRLFGEDVGVDRVRVGREMEVEVIAELVRVSALMRFGLDVVFSGCPGVSVSASVSSDLIVL